MNEEFDAILLHAEGGLKKRLKTPMTSTQFKVLEAFVKMGLPTLPSCPQFISNVNVERLVQSRFSCKLSYMPLHSPQEEWNQQQEEHVNKRKKFEFTLHQEELEVLAGAWAGLHVLVQRF